ncbi:MAG: zinc-binding dehydrogenase [Candidatus Methylomirabilia bacterium]
MKAVVFYGPGQLRYEEVPVPAPREGEVLVRIDAALTCGTDVKTFRHGHPVMIPHVPTVFGHELAGTVSGVGRGVRSVREADRVVAANSAPCDECPLCQAGKANLCEDLLFVNGAYGEYIVIPPRLAAKNLVRIHDDLPAARAAFAEPLACALLGIHRGGVQSGQTVAVFGHGPVGCLLTMAAHAKKARVLLVGKAGWRLERIRDLGLAECLDAAGAHDIVSEIRALTGGRGVDVAVDATGRPEVWEQAITSVARGGTVVFFGGCPPGSAVRLDTRRAHYDELTLVGAFHHTPEVIRQAVELLESGAIVPDGLITHRMGLSEVPRALEMMARGQALKVLIRPEDGEGG